jgi:hypothetical protein
MTVASIAMPSNVVAILLVRVIDPPMAVTGAWVTCAGEE